MNISVLIPVGPKQHHQQWLDEALLSVCKQTHKADEILLIDDMADLSETKLRKVVGKVNLRIWKSPWNLGVAHAFNFGVALARNNAVFMMGADDTLEPDCLDFCNGVYLNTGIEHRDRTYYYVGVKYMDTGEEQYVPCGAAMVTKLLWKANGGFPLETALGCSDAAMISIMMVHPEAGRYLCVNGKKPLYNYRRHSLTDTAEKVTKYSGAILDVRDVLTREWKPPVWNRYE